MRTKVKVFLIFLAGIVTAGFVYNSDPVEEKQEKSRQLYSGDRGIFQYPWNSNKGLPYNEFVILSRCYPEKHPGGSIAAMLTPESCINLDKSYKGDSISVLQKLNGKEVVAWMVYHYEWEKGYRLAYCDTLTLFFVDDVL